LYWNGTASILLNYSILICSDGLPGEWTPADFNTELSIIDEEKYD